MTVYSHSRLATFEQCPYRYKLKYIDKVDMAVETAEAFLGSRVHEVMEKLYRDLINGKENSLGELLEHYEAQWERLWSPNVAIVRVEYTPENYREVGRQCIRSYYEQHHPFSDGKTIGLEELVMVDLDCDGLYRLRGYIDRLVDKGGGLYEIQDYKTSARLPTQAEVDEDQQLARYHLAVQEMWPDVREVRLVWHYVRFGKTLVSTRTADQLEDLRRGTIGAIQTIEGASAFEPVKSALCDWCEYKPICPLWVHLRRIEDLPPEEVPLEDGVTLVDRLTRLKAKKKECEEQIEQIEDAIVAYGDKEGALVVFGSTHQAKVAKSSKVRFPKAGSPEREELDSIIKKAERWEELSVLSTSSLAKALEERALGEELTAQVEAFGEPYESVSVRLSKRKDIEE